MHALYLQLPYWLQNIGLSLYGFNLYRERFAGGIPVEAQLANDLFAPPNEQQLSLQCVRMRQMLAYAKAYVPYYSAHLQNVDVDTLHPQDLAAILPVLEKKDLIAQPELFLTQHTEHRAKLLKLNTSGSSGSPLSLQATYESRRINYYYYEQILAHFGCNYRSKSTTFAGRILYKPGSARVDRYDFFNRTQYLSSYLIQDSSIEAYINALNTWQPEFIDSYPSALMALIGLATQKHLTIKFAPKFVLVSSESLTDAMRATITAFFGAPLVDHYGCTEMAISAVSLGDGYFVMPQYSIVELEPAFDDTFSVITTGLLNFAMPLIRYRIGDLVQKPAGDSNYEFTQVVGRMDDVVVTPEGRQIGRMDPAFKGVVGVEESQIIQTAIDQLLVKIVLNSADSDFNEQLLTDNIKSRTSNAMNIQYEYLSSIPRGKNGKFKTVVSLLNKGANTP